METSGITNKTDRSGGSADKDKRASFQRLTRRAFLGSGAVAGTGVALTAPLLVQTPSDARAVILASHNGPHDAHSADAHRMGTVGTIGQDRQPVRPMHFLGAFNETEFPELLPSDFHLESKLPNGARLHEYLFIASDKEIEIAPGLYFPAWTYNGQVPGPTLRATRGDRIRIWFINEGSHPHTIHFHGWHPFEQDGSMLHQFVYPSTGEAMEYPFGPGADPTPWLAMDPIERRRRGLDIYEFEADPVGLHLYHCHSLPLKRHIHKGLYGTFIVDPPGGRPKIDPDTNQPLSADHPLHELVMVMNGFDTNFDGDNEVYAINSVAFHYQVNPIPVRIGDLVRVYLVNITEFDPINSFHLHAGFFRVYRTGTNLRSDEYSDMAMFCQGERAILEMRFREGWPGKYMFHAHQSEFAELGWMALFDAQVGKVMA